MSILITILTTLGFPRIELAESVGRRAYLDRAAFRADQRGLLLGFALMPRKPLAELYTAIGYHKHGKTEFYRDFLRHLDASEDQFENAEGDRGMVMVVFTLPSYDVVFKLIKDRFDYPKNSSRPKISAFKIQRAGFLFGYRNC